MPRARPGWAAQDAPRCPSPVTMSLGPPPRGLPVFLLPLRDPKVNSEPDPQWAICSPERATGCDLELATRRWPHPPPVAGAERDRAWPSCPYSVHSTCWRESLLVGRMCKRTGRRWRWKRCPPALSPFPASLRLGSPAPPRMQAEWRRFDVVRPHGGAAAPPALGGKGCGAPGAGSVLLLPPAPPWGLAREPGVRKVRR